MGAGVGVIAGAASLPVGLGVMAATTAVATLAGGVLTARARLLFPKNDQPSPVC